METITKKSLTLHVETSKGRELTVEFADYAALFDFVTQRLMGDASFDHEAEQLIHHTDAQWARRCETYPEGKFWTYIEERKEPSPEQIVYNVAQRDSSFRRYLIEQLTAMGEKQDVGPFRKIEPYLASLYRDLEKEATNAD